MEWWPNNYKKNGWLQHRQRLKKNKNLII